MRKSFTFLILIITICTTNTVLAANIITTDSITPRVYCMGDSIYVPFTKTGTFNVGNVFTAQLSSATGSFASPTAIGTLTDTAAGIIPCTLPSATSNGGTHYLIRVVSSSPVVTGIADPDTFTIQWSVYPVLTAIGNTTFCSGDSVRIINGASGLTSFQWQLNDVNLPGDTLYDLTATQQGLYTLIGSNGLCSETSFGVVVVVNPSPVIAFSGDSEICINATANITASGGYQYVWSPSYALNLTNVANVHANPTVTTTYTVMATATNQCTSTSTINVTVSHIPVINAFYHDPICQGDSTQITATGANTYTWSPSITLNRDTGNDVIANPTTTTTYTIIGTDTGCSHSYSFTVYVNPLPVITITGPDTMCIGQSVTLTATGASAYIWTPSTALSDSMSATVSANPDSTITYTISGKDTNDCISSTTFTLVVELCTGVNELENEIAINIYPNPSNRAITLHSSMSIVNYQLSIDNVFGEKIYSEIITDNTTTIDVSNWSKGIYFYEFNGMRGKFLVE
jgi:hypothetical protein